MLVKKVVFLCLLVVSVFSCKQVVDPVNQEYEPVQLGDCETIWENIGFTDFCEIDFNVVFNKYDENGICFLGTDINEKPWSHNDDIRINVTELGTPGNAKSSFESGLEVYQNDSGFKEVFDIGDGCYVTFESPVVDVYNMTMDFYKGLVSCSITVSNMDCFYQEDVYELARRIVDQL